ncbi:N2,N2-dimethylguanosine tRNA methyltransferase [Fistulina hepatica ATCC 64428]|nr:N2,N2-dimethylguanosine tRNA methyltransferase [Fistulina hepatica ATCC 64428]
MSTASPVITVPEGFKLHTENGAHLLLSPDEAFLNPVQEFNRDTSIACIRVWTEELNKKREERWRRAQDTKLQKSAKKKQRGISEQSSAYYPYKSTIIEALSATGLRSIRYAKEIPLVKYVIANDFSPAAVEAMKRNVELNGLGPTFEDTTSDSPKLAYPGKVRVNQGDASALMYEHRHHKSQVDVVDLDPYGTAAPFIDAAVQCVSDGGLLCVTCTDLATLGTVNYPEKCYSCYGGAPAKAEYCHEVALRLVLHSVSTAAARYGRFITPLLSLSIDFYVRLFIRIETAPIEVKKAASKTSLYYVCSACQAFYEQRLGRTVERRNEVTGNVNYSYRVAAGPPLQQSTCPQCNSTLHVAGPMWSAPLHDKRFVSNVLDHLEENGSSYGTAARMKGMLTVAHSELDALFYFTPSKIASMYHSVTPSLDEMGSALLNAGYEISRSHACPGSLKTTAPVNVIHDIFRGWVKKNPVKMENLPENSAAKSLLAKEPSIEADFTHHAGCSALLSKIKLVRYQENPTKYWGPGTKASGKKRKHEKVKEPEGGAEVEA